MKHSSFFAIMTGCTLLLPLSAQAAVQVIGTGMSHDCFMAALAGVDPHGGVAICNAALEQESLSADNEAATYINRGVMEAALGQNDNAMADYNHGIAMEPGLGDAYIDRGSGEIFMKRYDDAMTDINKGIGLGMSYPHIGYYDRGIAEELMGKYKEAYYDLKHALELEPNFTKASDELKYFKVTTVKNPS